MLATGNVPVQYTQVADGFRGTDQTVDQMARLAMGKWGARSPKIRALARNILDQAGVREKDYTGEAYALATWVRDHIRYLRDPYGQETLSTPEEVAFNTRAEDCDGQATLLAALLGSVGIPSRFKVIGQTPQMYSHVYLQARPGNRWITFDPIMSDKPSGWEVPRHQRLIEKAYPVNGPDGWLPETGVNGMHGLSGAEESRYVGDPRIVSHLQLPSIPMGAGRGQRPPRSAGHPAYVSMPSGLDNDWMDESQMAFHPNQNSGRRVGPQPMRRHGPAGPPGGRIPEAQVHPAEQAALDGRHEVYGPDAIAGLSAIDAINRQPVPAHMTAVAVAQAPEGVDNQFSRAAMVLDPNQGDKVLYDGYWNDPMVKPVPKPVTNLAGVQSNPRDMLPGMGHLEGATGPGLGDGASGAGMGLLAQDAIPVPTPAPGIPTGVKVAAALGLAYLLFARKRG